MKTSFSHLGVVLVTILMFSTLFVAVTSSASYDPWLDMNDDGVIDMKDIGTVVHGFGTAGEPYEAKAALAYDSGWIDITDKAGSFFNITHNLHSTENVIDVNGKITQGGEAHRKHYGGPGDPQSVGWIRWYEGPQGEEAYSVVQTSDGGFAIAGSTSSFGAGSADFWLVRTTSDGTVNWNMTYGGAGADFARAVVETSGGGFALAGYTQSFGAGDWDLWVVKTDQNGNMEWNQTYGGTGVDKAESIVRTSDGGYALAGETLSFGEPNGDFWLVKTDASGNAVWNKTYGTIEPAFQTPVPDYAYSVIQTIDGGYALAGATSVWAGIGDWYTSWWLVKTDAAGTVQWNQTFGYEFWGAIATCVVQTRDGGYAVAGGSGLTVTSTTALLVKTNANGDREWFAHYTGMDEVAEAWSMVQTVDGGYALAGSAWSADEGRGFFLVKANATGWMQWARKYNVYGHYPCAQGMAQTTGGGYVLAGYSSNLGDGECVAMKVDAFGLMEDLELGLSVTNITDDTITLYRGAIDPYWNFVRVRIWKIKIPTP